MSDLEQAVSEDAGSAAAEETTTSTDTGSEVGAGTAGTAAASRTYDDAAVQRILRDRLDQQKRSYEKKLSEFQKKQQEWEAMSQRLNKGFDAFARGLGLVQDEKPKYVDEKTAEERFSALETKLRREFEEKRLYEHLKSEWKSVASKHARYAAIPGFKEAVLAQYQNGDAEMTEIADKIASEWAKHFAIQDAIAAQEKVAEAGKAKVVKPGGGAGAPSTKEAKGSISERLQKKLRGE